MDEVNWADKFGTFEHAKDKIAFPGGTSTSQEGVISANIGMTFCSEYFGNGKISAEISFTEIDPTLNTVAEIVVYQNLESGELITIGLGGNNYMYSARHYVGSSQWRDLGSIGFKDTLVAGNKYQIEISVTGSRFGLNVNGVDVIEGTLPFPIDRSQPGVFVISSKKVTFSHFKVDSEKPLCFVMMQYSTPYNELYQKIIKPICENEFKMRVVRADEMLGPGQIVDDILKGIKEAKILIAEVSPANPNVYYELGYAHALEKNVILIAEKKTDLPFDIRNARTLFYENTIDGTDKIKEGLSKHLTVLTSR